ncbi:Hypothetical protein LUCI_3641 [Lucifera butyrica]|uniref:4Fe-4S ferredoxin-type domain-containing protein n=1 Tax=Lucifera butyrica TaxID=1351585 RepID=A0A498RAX7_9FIRM|nr:ATP-binding protein [Lucifera butyrica]VBB08369.1 Hypothetical protein LUCI_3641 [Lucifera butyrica]
MFVSIASGKGGTGKTTLALLLAAAHKQITLIDCDVEEPNCHLFLKPTWEGEGKEVAVMVPRIDADRCNGCGACADLCLFNAIAVAGDKALVFDELCHSCGGCLLACRQGAIAEDRKPVGVITSGISTTIPGLRLVSGALNVGVPSGVPLIKAIKQKAMSLGGDVIFDCPPGTSCSMVNAVRDSDFCILVTEPTPFGRHDLELAMNIAGLLRIPTGVVINKSDGAGDESVEELCRDRRIPVLAKIPHSLSFARQYAAGIISDEFRAVAAGIWRQLRQERSAEA